MKHFAHWALPILTVIVSATNVWAQDDDSDSFLNYDNIVNELKADADDTPKFQPYDMDWEDVALHGGMSLVGSALSIAAPAGIEGTGLMKGFEGHVGVNLFSRKARAEGAFRTFAKEPIQSNLQVNLREFETRLVFLPSLQDRTRLRMGLGVAARYMDISFRENGAWGTVANSSLSSSVFLGFERKISPNVSVGPDVAYRSPLTSDIYHKSAWDTSFRLNATF